MSKDLWMRLALVLIALAGFAMIGLPPSPVLAYEPARAMLMRSAE